MNRVMVDIETYATEFDKNGRGPQILQIGAAYSRHGIVEDEELFLVSIADVEDPEYYSSMKTRDWWAKQSKEAQESLHMNLVAGTAEALLAFNRWLDGIRFNKGIPKWTIWANPPQFDLTFLQFAYTKEQIELPWHFRQERCCRTIWNELPQVPVEYPEGLVAHRADHDAVRQLVGIEAALMHIQGY